MTISAHLETFAGQPVQQWSADSDELDPAIFYRVAVDYEDPWTDHFAEFLDHPGVDTLRGLVVGAWGEMNEEGESARIVEALVAARERMPNLRALFFGDITFEETEISWIQNTDVSPLFDAYPALEHFGVRGSNGLRLGTLRHANLRSLTVQSGGLDAAIADEVSAAELPALEHLSLWLGTQDYGGTTAVEDFATILNNTRFPGLRYLGLCNSDYSDKLAAALATAPVVEHLDTLDLSLGTLGDEGAAALLASPAVARLKKLDIHHHYCTSAMVERLQGLGIEVDASEPQEDDEYDGERYRYVAVGE